MAVTFVRSALMVPGKFPKRMNTSKKRIKWLKAKFGVEASFIVTIARSIASMCYWPPQEPDIWRMPANKDPGCDDVPQDNAEASEEAVSRPALIEGYR